VYHRLLVIIDGSENSWRVAETAIETAALLHAHMDILSLEVPSQDHQETPQERIHQHDWSAQLQVPIRSWAKQRGILPRSVVLHRQDEAQAILDYSKEHHCDLIVLGATGRDYPWQTTISETARRVAHEAPCAVLLVRAPALQYRVHDIMATNVPCVTQHAPLSEVISFLIEGGIKLLPVVNHEQRVLGVITLGYLLTHDDAFRRLDLQHATSTESLGQYMRQLFTAEKTVEDVMQRHPLVVKDDATLEVAAQQMISHHVTRLPVVNREGRFVGMLDQARLLHYYTDLPDVSERGFGEEGMQQAVHPQTVSEAVLTPVPLVPVGMPLMETVRRVQETPFRRVIVIDSDGKAVGVIADSDLLASRGLAVRRNPILALAGRFSLNIPEDLFRHRSSSGPLVAQHVMRPRLFAVAPATSVAEAIRLMLAHQIKRLAVVDETGKPLGLVDRQQLLRSLLKGDTMPT
jgi:CBS domain-containing protein